MPNGSQSGAPMCARDVMTTTIVAVKPGDSTREIAGLLLDHGISAVPVVAEDGTPIGMVSEGDLIGRNEQDRVARHDWWLRLATGRQTLDDDFSTLIKAPRTARDVMTAPVVTVAEDTAVDQVARLLTLHHVKRVPVLREGRIVGIVSRADLLRAVTVAPSPASASGSVKRGGFLRSLFGDYHRPAWEVVPPATTDAAASQPRHAGLNAEDFRGLAADFQHGEYEHQDAERRAAAQERRQRAKALIDAHVSDATWRDMLHRAREAAERGATDYLLLRFPSQLCLDGGRAINIAEADWPATLRGEPAELYLLWERELKPRNFRLSARVLDCPDGKPGDVGLFLAWGE
jgi:CBS domain-containing protein